jgi:L-iditol 2-dehydrogenase
VVADVNPHRLAAAGRLGATGTADLTATTLADGYAARPAPDVVLECTGHAGVTADAVRVLARAGTAVLVGMGGDELPLPLSVLQERELTLTGTFRYANTWPTAIALVATGRVDLDALVTGRFPLAQTGRALAAARTDPGALKAVVLPQQ